MFVRSAIAALFALSFSLPVLAAESVPSFRWGLGKVTYIVGSATPQLIVEGQRPAYREFGDTEVLVRVDRPAPGARILVSGLPAGVSFDGSVIGGNPMTSGIYEVTVRLEDEATGDLLDERLLTLEVFGMLSAELDGTFEVNSGEVVDLLPTVENDLGGGVEWTISPLPDTVISGLNFDKNTGRIWGEVEEEASFDGFAMKAFDLVDMAEADVAPFSISVMAAAAPDAGPWLIKINSVSVAGTAATPDGGVIFAGNATVSGRSSDAVVGKVDEAGNLVWITPFGTTGSESVSAVKVLGDGSPVIVGTASNDLFIARLTASGEVMAGWPKTFGDGAIQRGKSLAVTADGSFIAGGQHYTSTYDSSFLFVKVSANGSLEWASRVGYLGVRSADHIAVDDLTGAIYGADSSGFVVRLNGDGTYDSTFSKEIWITNSIHYVRGISAAPDGGLVIAGNYEVKTFGASPTTTQYPYMGKFNADGTVAWGKGLVYDAASGGNRSVSGMFSDGSTSWVTIQSSMSGTAGTPTLVGVIPVDLATGSLGTPVSMSVDAPDFVAPVSFSGGHTYFAGRFDGTGGMLRLPEELGDYGRMAVRDATASAGNKAIPFNTITNWTRVNMSALGLQQPAMTGSGVELTATPTPLEIAE